MLDLEIVTPEKKVVDETVDSVRIPTPNGEIGILEKHAPLISKLRPGILSYTKGLTTERMLVSGGFVEVSADKVAILTDITEKPGDVDIENARSERADFEKVLGAWAGSAEEFKVHLEKLDRANARLELTAKN